MIGQYCHGNHPDHEAPFSYYFIGKPEKSQKVLDHILKKIFTVSARKDSPFPEWMMREKMSAWYAFTATGLYTLLSNGILSTLLRFHYSTK